MGERVEKVQPARAWIDTWQAAELNAATWMRFWGFGDAAVTRAGADGGIDVRSARGVAQVKWVGAQVSRPEIQRLVGAAVRHPSVKLLFFTGTGYSAMAIQEAERSAMALFTYSMDGKMTPVNAAARAVSKPPDAPKQPRKTTVVPSAVPKSPRKLAPHKSEPTMSVAAKLITAAKVFFGLMVVASIAGLIVNPLGITQGTTLVRVGVLVIAFMLIVRSNWKNK